MNKISTELKEKMKQEEKIVVVIKLNRIDEEILKELRKLGEIEEIVKLTKHVQMTLTPQQISVLSQKDYVLRIDLLRKMKAVK